MGGGAPVEGEWGRGRGKFWNGEDHLYTTVPHPKTSASWGQHNSMWLCRTHVPSSFLPFDINSATLKNVG